MVSPGYSLAFMLPAAFTGSARDKEKYGVHYNPTDAQQACQWVFLRSACAISSNWLVSWFTTKVAGTLATRTASYCAAYL